MWLPKLLKFSLWKFLQAYHVLKTPNGKRYTQCFAGKREELWFSSGNCHGSARLGWWNSLPVYKRNDTHTIYPIILTTLAGSQSEREHIGGGLGSWFKAGDDHHHPAFLLLENSSLGCIMRLFSGVVHQDKEIIQMGFKSREPKGHASTHP